MLLLETYPAVLERCTTLCSPECGLLNGFCPLPYCSGSDSDRTHTFGAHHSGSGLCGGSYCSLHT